MLTKLLCASVLAAAASAQTYTLTSFGTSCGGTLQGQVVSSRQGDVLRLGVAGATPNTIAVLAIGGLATTPHPLPGSNCLLLVDPRGTQISLTDGRGHAQFQLRLPPVVPITVHLQAATVDFTRLGRAVETTNGLRLDGV